MKYVVFVVYSKWQWSNEYYQTGVHVCFVVPSFAYDVKQGICVQFKMWLGLI